MTRSPKKVPIKLVRKRLDDAGVIAHFAALARDAEAIELRVKDAVAHYSDATAGELDEACRRLRNGELMAVQVRFCQDGVWWCDTIMRATDDYRLVRMHQGAAR